MLGRMKEAIQKSRPFFLTVRSDFCIRVLDLLYTRGFISGYFLVNDYTIKVQMKNVNGRPFIRSIVLYSTPGRTVYYSFSGLQQHLCKSDTVAVMHKNGLCFFYEAQQLREMKCQSYGHGGVVLFGITY